LYIVDGELIYHSCYHENNISTNSERYNEI